MARLGDASEAEAHPGVPWLRVALAAGLVLVAGLIVLPWATNVRESARRSSAQGNLKQLGLVFKMYAGENQGRFPPLAPCEGVWMADLRVLYPEYLTTPEPLVNPRLPDAGERLERLEALLRDEPVDWERVHRLAAESLTYTGYVVDDVEEAERLANLRADARLDEAGTIPPLQEGVERFFITDINNPAGSTQAQSAIPVLFEAVYPEGERGALPLGINVLYMDGHVEFIRWGEAFPALREVGEVLPPPSDKPGEIE
jgi:prepilin-type processing-associated H-X9-DG protein